MAQKDIENKLQSDVLKNTFSLLDFSISTTETLKCIHKLKKGKTPGIDSVSNDMILAGRSELAPVLAKTFNNILLSGSFPEIWAISYVKPLFKSGSMYDPANYRGISLSS